MKVVLTQPHRLASEIFFKCTVIILAVGSRGSSLFSVDDFPDGQFVGGEARAAQQEESRVLKALLLTPKDFAEHFLRVVATKRLQAAGGVAFLVDPNLDKCQGRPDPPNSQTFVSQFSEACGSAIELADVNSQAKGPSATYGAVDIAEGPDNLPPALDSKKIVQLRILTSPGTGQEVADTILSGVYLALSSCAVPTCNYRAKPVSLSKEELRQFATVHCGDMVCPLMRGLRADLSTRGLSNVLQAALTAGLQAPHGAYENQTYANLGALQDCLK